MRDYLIHRARPFLFSKSHPPAVIAACNAALDVIINEPQLIVRLWENTRFFKRCLQALGFDTGNSETLITPVIVGEDVNSIRLSKQLFERGVFAQSIIFPTVPRRKARVRTVVLANHSKHQLQRAIDAFAEAGKELGLI